MSQSWKAHMTALLWETYLTLLGLILTPPLVATLTCIFTPTLFWRPIAKLLSPLLRPDLAAMLSCPSSVFAQVDDSYCKAKSMNVLEITVQGRLDLDEFINHIHTKWISCRDDDSVNLRYPELQQYPVNWAGYKFWKWEDNFTLKRHIRSVNKITTRSELTQIGVELMSGLFPEETSPWDLTLVPTIDGEKEVTVIIFRLHHLLGDGFAIHFLFQRMWGSDRPIPIIKPTPKAAPWTWRQAKYVALFPFKAARMIGELAHFTVTKATFKVPEAQKGLKWSLALGTPISSGKIIKVKNHFKVSFTAVLFSAVAGGLRRFILTEYKNGSTVPNIIPTVTTVLAGGRHPDKMCNQFSFALASYPVGISDPIEQLHAMDRNLNAVSDSPASVISNLFDLRYYAFVLLGSHVNWVGRLVNVYPYASLATSYYPFGFSPEWNVFGNRVSQLTFYLKLQQGQQGGMICISSFGDSVQINPVFNANLVSTEEAVKLAAYIEEQVLALEAAALTTRENKKHA